MLQRSILYCNLINSSGNLVGPDDHEAYHRLQNGLTTDASEWVSMGRHIGAETANDEGGYSATGSSDMVFRSQFKAWKNYMSNAGGK
jgi:benzoate/toluate 1,2-dioxygenase alpha subunit